jgi:hypothetical protein
VNIKAHVTCLQKIFTTCTLAPFDLRFILSAQGIRDHSTFLENVKSVMLVFCIGNTNVKIKRIM